MMILGFALAATIAGQDGLPVMALRPGDQRAACPAYLAQGMASSGRPPLAEDACIWSDTSDEAQNHYVNQLRKAGWVGAGGVANMMRLRNGRSCIALSGWPVEMPADNAIGSGRDLRQPRPADTASVFLILQEEPGACASAGDH